jgi:hypothetical protein
VLAGAEATMPPAEALAAADARDGAADDLLDRLCK